MNYVTIKNGVAEPIIGRKQLYRKSIEQYISNNNFEGHKDTVLGNNEFTTISLLSPNNLIIDEVHFTNIEIKAISGYVSENPYLYISRGKEDYDLYFGLARNYNYIVYGNALNQPGGGYIPDSMIPDDLIIYKGDIHFTNIKNAILNKTESNLEYNVYSFPSNRSNELINFNNKETINYDDTNSLFNIQDDNIIGELGTDIIVGGANFPYNWSMNVQIIYR